MRVYLERETSLKNDLGTYLVSLETADGSMFADSSGNGIINADGSLWKVQRKAGLHFLSAANLRVLTEVALPEFLKQNVQALEEALDGSIIDLEAVFHELTTQLMGQMAYNVSIDKKALI